MLAFSLDRQPGNATSVRVGRSVDDARELTFGESSEANDQLLSPTGAWLSYLLVEFNGPPEQDDVRAFTVQVRTPAPLSLAAAAFAVPVAWLDDTTLQLLVLAPQQASMYSCTAPDGTCERAADLPLAAIDGNNLVLPGGIWTGR